MDIAIRQRADKERQIKTKNKMVSKQQPYLLKTIISYSVKNSKYKYALTKKYTKVNVFFVTL
jgi:hypothetical protein